MALTQEDLQAIAALIQPLQDGIMEVKERVGALEDRMTALETRMDALETRMDALEARMDALEVRMDALEVRMDALEARMDALEARMDALEVRMDAIEDRMDAQETRTTKLELHMENGTDKNIQLLAENFVELTKKLNQAIPAADKNLAYEVKVNYLIEEVEKLKEQVAEINKRTA